MKGGLTPVVQPLEILFNKVFKGYLRELYEIFALTDPVNPATGAPFPPSYQQNLTWIVEAWEQVTEELFSKAWTACGYKKNNDSDGDINTGLVPYSDDQVGELVQRMCGDDTYVKFQDEADVGADPIFPKDDEDCEE